MKLKRLILQGFKSFADRTEFEFQDGITVIVGPNGCGKSNVVDAVKWVLGEQRPTSLRGKEMQDVIFSGTDQRRALGFAEVTLIFDNRLQLLPVDYDEVSVTRRLYRSGESEYQLNGNTVRLRDIRELLMDSGGGPGALTVMEQGNVDRLLRADPAERRLVFEEAAGIAKYRSRRKETERKLERTLENLARLRDILSEYETRQRSLKIQAGKARRWKEYTEDLKKKRLIGAFARYADLRAKRDDAAGALAASASAEADARAELELASVAFEDERHGLEELREQAARGEARMATLVGESRAAAERRGALAREVEDLDRRGRAARHDSEEARDRAGRLRGELETAREELAQAETERAARADRLAAATQAVETVEERIRAVRAEREDSDRARADAFRAETDARNGEVGHEAELRSLRTRLARLEERARHSDEELTRLEATRRESDRLVEEAEEALAALERQLQEAEEETAAARVAIERAGADEAAHREERRALLERREMLARLVADGEGLSAGTRALLQAGREGELEGIRGTLAGLVGDAGPRARALDQALGDVAGAVVCATTTHAVAALRWLEEGERGRARVLPLDRVVPTAPSGPFAGLDGEAGGLVGALLAGTHFAETLDEALAHGTGRRVVVLGGAELEPAGAILGGAGDGADGLVTRHAELAALHAQLERTERELAEASGVLAEERGRLRRAEERIADLRPRLGRARAELRERSESLAAAARVASTRAEENDLERGERADVERMIAESAGALAEARARREEAERRRVELEQAGGRFDELLTGLARERDEAGAHRTEVRVAAARWIEKAESGGQRVSVLEGSIAEAEREARTRGEEVERCAVRRTECEGEIEELAAREEELQGSIDSLRAELDERRQRVRAMQERIDETDRRLKGLRAEHERRRDARDHDRMRESELRLRIEALLEQVTRDYGLSLEQVEPPPELAGEDPDATPPDPEELEREIQDLRARIEKLGNVNHAALEELAEVESRLDFMRREESDLMEADRQLRDTIERIDDVCTTRFTETFEQVCEHFKTIFRKLFGGGRAELFLEDPEDTLNSGIEIRVRPPGKELRSMALLSGGERSLTTVALLFSIYQTKPPPFCLLDEVDAALDEANTVRMCGMLKEFARDGQFLVITHARPTMTVADTLYGVTMPEPGVSRRVAVRFSDIEAGRVVGLN